MTLEKSPMLGFILSVHGRLFWCLVSSLPIPIRALQVFSYHLLRVQPRVILGDLFAVDKIPVAKVLSVALKFDAHRGPSVPYFAIVIQGFPIAVSPAMPLAPLKQHIEESRIVGQGVAARNLLQLSIRKLVFIFQFPRSSPPVLSCLGTLPVPYRCHSSYVM